MDIFFGRSKENDGLWQDREIRFEASTSDLSLVKGELLIATVEPVEDTKGNNGEPGQLLMTNLRLIWLGKKSKRLNISIGYKTVTAIDVKAVSSRLKGATHSLHLLTKLNQSRYEFIFTSMLKSTSQLLHMVQAVFKAYEGSTMYRELKLRGCLIQDRELRMLPTEQTYSRVNGVWNLSSDQGNLGTFFISNVRVVWYANLADNFNVSIPYLQMKKVKVADSKFGPALVMETTSSSGGYVLGFKVDPKETLEYVHKEISSLRKAYMANPIFGVECDATAMERQAAALAALHLTEQEEDVAVIDAQDKADLVAAYYADASQGVADRPPVFCEELGLAIESLKEGSTIEQLWSVL